MGCLLLLIGCADRVPSADVRAEAQRAFTAGEQSLSLGHFEQAEAHLTLAIEQGAITADQSVEAHLMRATARCELHRFDDALTDLAIAQQGAGVPERVELLRAHIFEAQARSSDARSREAHNKNARTDYKESR